MHWILPVHFLCREMFYNIEKVNFEPEYNKKIGSDSWEVFIRF